MEKNILVTRSSMPEYEEYIEEIKDIWDSRWLTNMGSKHNRLIEELKTYLDVDHLDLLTNGHMALELTLQALNLSGEVITTPFTFISTTHAITRNGLGTGYVLLSTVISPSSIACSSAACVREVALFSSSARKKLQRIAPF